MELGRLFCPYPAYTPSGVPWLGDMPEHWDVRRGGWLFRKMDRAVSDADEVITCFRDGTVTLRKNRRTEGFTESLKEIGYQGVRKGDLVIHQMDAFAGAVGVSDSDGKGTPVYSVCYPTDVAHSLYYAHVVREMARNQWILALAKGIRERSTDFRYSEFARQEFPLPPLPEQAAIVRYLDHVDRRVRRYVAAKRKLITLLEEEKQAVVNRAVTRGLDPNVRLKPSGVEWLGDVPEHWEVVRLASVSLPKSMVNQQHRELLPVYLNLGVIRFSDVDERRTNPTSQDLSSYQAVDPGDLVLNNQQAWRGSVGVSNFEGIVSPAYFVLELTRRMDQKFADLLFRDKSMVGQYLVCSKGVGTIQRNLYWPHLKGALTLVPPLTEQAAIVEYLDEATAGIDTAIARARRQIELVEEYRTRLIADVVTGKLDVREAAAQLPDESDEEGPIDRDGLVLDNMDDGSSDVSQLLEEEQTMEREVTA